MDKEIRIKDEASWIQYKNRTRGWCIRVEIALLDSEAFKDLAYTPSVKVLMWFHEKVKVRKNKGKRKAKEKWSVINKGEISFTYEEAILRGLSRQQFSKALKDLYSHGFIDVERPGTGRKGDYTKYSMSERWRDFGKDTFEIKEFPRSLAWRSFGDFRRRPKSKKMVIHRRQLLALRNKPPYGNC